MYLLYSIYQDSQLESRQHLKARHLVHHQHSNTIEYQLSGLNILMVLQGPTYDIIIENGFPGEVSEFVKVILLLALL